MSRLVRRAHSRPLQAAIKLALMTATVGLTAALIGTFALADDASHPGSTPPALINDVNPPPAGSAGDDSANNVPLLPGRPDMADASGDVLGPLYINHTACISFHVPTGSKKVLQVSPDLLVEFDDPVRQWELKAAMIVRKTPLQLTTREDLLNPGSPPATRPASTTQPAGAQPEEGLMELTLDNLKRTLPEAKVLREDLTSLPNGDQSMENNVGLLALRYTVAGKRRLAQQALIAGNDRVFYVLTLTSPGKDDNASPIDDPREIDAVNTFRQVLDSVTLLDRASIRREQEDRLYCTRSLFVNFTPARLKAALIPEQWLRVIRDGKDVGYTYICEQQAGDIPHIGQKAADPELTPHIEIVKPAIPPGSDILVGVRSRTITDGVRSDKTIGPVVSDNESWLFSTLDRSHEEWSRETLIDDRLVGPNGKPKRPIFVEELGDSNKRLKNVMLPVPDGAPPFTKPQMGVKQDYKLDVEQVNAGAALAPLTRDLSPFYTPQAISHLLPRLLPLHEPRGYMFATYVGDAREVMMRYVDVLPQQVVDIAGKSEFAVPIDDRIGIDGSVVTHYFSPTGKYLGSENKDAETWILPSDSDTIQKIWSGNALLVVPSAAAHHTEAEAQ
jgi:hypothetical protein